MALAQSEAEATALRNLSLSWNKLANQTDRYAEITSEKSRAARNKWPKHMPSYSYELKF